MDSARTKTNRRAAAVRALSLAALGIALLPGPAFALGPQRDAAFGGDAPALVRSVSAFSLATVAPDAFEDDRLAPQAVSDTALPLAQDRTIHAAAGDADWDSYRLAGTPGTLYTFETTGAADTVLEVRNAATNEALAWYDDKGDGSLGSRGYWRCPSAGAAILVKVGPANSLTGRGGYSISITGVPGAERAGSTERVYGTSRYAGAVRIASDTYRNAAGSPWHYYTQAGEQKNVSRVIVTSGDSAAYYMPMIAQPLARIYNAPVLLVGEHTLPTSTRDAIKAIRANNGGSVDVYVIGSTGTVSSGVYSRLKSLKGSSGSIERISAADRYRLCAKIADRVDAAWVRDMGEHAARVIVANGSRSGGRTDLLAASGLAYRMGWPILLTKTSSVPSATYSRIKSGVFRRSRVTVVNSRTYVSSGAYRRVSGDSRLSSHSGRTASALDIARKSIGYHWLMADDVVVVNRTDEALTAGTYAGKRGSVVLVSATDGPGGTTQSYFLARPSMVESVAVVGSSGSVSTAGVAVLRRLAGKDESMATLVTIGDSITALTPRAVGYPSDPPTHWQRKWLEALGSASITDVLEWNVDFGPDGSSKHVGSKHTVFNRGLGGNTTGQMVARFAEDVVSLSPDAVHILGGSNDVAIGLAADETTRNLSAMVDMSLANHTRVIIGTIPPRGHVVTEMTGSDDPDLQEFVDTTDECHERVLAINSWIRKSYDETSNVIVVDYFDALGVPGDHHMRVGMTADGVHLSEAGQDAFVRILHASGAADAHWTESTGALSSSSVDAETLPPTITAAAVDERM